jgi:hypothetical protein
VIVKKSDGTPVEGAAVSVTELGQSGTTGADGLCDFGEVPPASYTAVGQKDNFAPPGGGNTTAAATQTQAAPASTSTQIALVLDALVGRMSVHVQKTDGTPVDGVTVSVDGKGWSGVTDASGNFDFGEVPADTYTVNGEKTNYGPVPATQSQEVVIATSVVVQLTMNPVTVVLSLDQPVACPGHPLAITATGDPAGGTYAWTIAAPSADLVDGSGATTRAGNVVNLRGFQADTGTGNIPAQTAVVTVTYTSTNGQTATATSNVPIHAITFTMTNNTITSKPTTTAETSTTLTIGDPGGGSVMYTKPSVKLQLDASCPRKSDCAGSHRMGWLQTCLTNTCTLRYTHTLIQWTPPMPVRDAAASAPQPFYNTVATFAADGDTQSVVHDDNPSLPGSWTDPRPGAPPPPPPKNQQLRQASRAMSFTAWLVVQNTEWAAHDLPGSLAYIGNFNWSMSMNVTVDTSKTIGPKATPTSSPPTVPASISAGQGGSTPNLAAPTANQGLADPANYHVDPAPELP